jgi:hypothetical protein
MMNQTIIEATSLTQLDRKVQELVNQGWTIVPGSIQVLNRMVSKIGGNECCPEYACILQKESTVVVKNTSHLVVDDRDEDWGDACSEIIFQKVLVDGATVSISEQNEDLVAKISDVKGELRVVFSTDCEGYPSVDISGPKGTPIVAGEYDSVSETFVSMTPDENCFGFNRPEGPVYVSIARRKNGNV